MEIVTLGAPASDGMAAMPDRTRKAMVRALNRGINSARTVMVSRIAKDTGLKSKDVRDALKVTPATFNRLVARMATSLKRIPLIKFGARGPEPSRGRGKGVTYKLLGGGRGVHPQAFIARMTSMGRISSAKFATLSPGHRGIFERKGKARLPIRELYGPSLGHVFRKYRPEAAGIAQEMFDRNFGRELTFQASRG